MVAVLQLGFGAKVNARAQDDATPLSFAIQKGHAAVVNELLGALLLLGGGGGSFVGKQACQKGSAKRVMLVQRQSRLNHRCVGWLAAQALGRTWAS